MQEWHFHLDNDQTAVQSDLRPQEGRSHAWCCEPSQPPAAPEVMNVAITFLKQYSPNCVRNSYTCTTAKCSSQLCQRSLFCRRPLQKKRKWSKFREQLMGTQPQSTTQSLHPRRSKHGGGSRKILRAREEVCCSNCFLDMTGNFQDRTGSPYPWNLNTMVAKTRCEQCQHQLIGRCDWSQSHGAPTLDEEL